MGFPILVRWHLYIESGPWCWCTYLGGGCLLFRILKLTTQKWSDMHLTHWGRDKMAAIFQTTFWNGFSSMKMYEYRLKFHLSLFLRVKLTIFRHWFRKWLGADQATSHFMNQWWLVCWRIYASLGLNELINRCWKIWSIPHSTKHTIRVIKICGRFDMCVGKVILV